MDKRSVLHSILPFSTQFCQNIGWSQLIFQYFSHNFSNFQAIPQPFLHYFWLLFSLCSMQCIHAMIVLLMQILDIKRCLHVCPQSASSIRNLVTLVGKLPSSQWCDSLVQGFDSRLIRRIQIRLFCSLATQVIQMLNVLPPPSTSSPTSTSCPFARTAPTSLLISRSQIAKDNFEIETCQCHEIGLIVSFSQFQSLIWRGCETLKREAPFAVNHH